MYVENIVRRPYKIRVEVRTYDRTRFTVTLASNSTRALRPVIEAISVKPYAEYIDRYGYVRVVYRNLAWPMVQRIRELVRKHIGGGESAAGRKAATTYSL